MISRSPHVLSALAACLIGWGPAGADEPRDLADRPLNELLQIIEHPRQPTERCRAAEAVTRYGEDAVPGLCRLFHSRESVIRSYALVGLTRLGPQAEQAVPDLLAAVQDPGDPLRDQAAVTLGRIGPGAAQAVPALRELALRGRAASRRAALGALIGIGDAAALTVLNECLTSPDNPLPSATLTALAEIDEVPPQVFPALAARALAADDSLSGAALSLLVRIGPPMLPHVVPGLQSEQADVRRRAAAAVSRLGRDGRTATPVLAELLRDEDANVRFWAAKALGEIGEPARPATRQLLACLRDPDADVRWQAIVTLRHIAGNSPEFLASLAALRQDPHPTVRKLAEEILGPPAAGKPGGQR